VKASGVPVVVVLVSGRPLDIAAELPGWNALLAAWLPGTEGGGVADVLFGDYAPTGKLPMSWASSTGQQPINDGDGKSPLFAYGYGLAYGPQPPPPPPPPPVTRSAYEQIMAASYDEQRGTQTEHCNDAGCGDNVGWIANGDYLGYTAVDFGSSSPTTLTTRVASGSSVSGTIEYRLDSPTGTRIASVPISNTGGWQTWTSTAAATTATVTGVHKLYLAFTSPSSQDFANLRWFQFGKDSGGGPVSSSAWYELVNQSGGGCVDAAGWGTSNGTAVQQWACGAGQHNQQWKFTPTDAGNYRVMSRNAPDQMLDVTGGPSATADGVAIQTWTWAGGANQQWQPVALASGSYKLVARHSSKCLEVPGGSSANGTRLRQATCNGSMAQAFRLVEKP
jgi:hypothetical protein